MKEKVCVFIGAMIIALGISSAGLGKISSTSYTITTTVLSSGGTPMSSTNYQTNFTLGQPSPIVITDSTNFTLNSGFWYTMVQVSCIWDFEPDGDVDGLDLDSFIDGYGPTGYNESDLESFRTEFGKTDCPN